MPSTAKPGLIFRAIPDDGTAGLGYSRRGQPEYRQRNVMGLPKDAQSVLSPCAVDYWYPGDDVPHGIEWVVNTCTDADSFGRALDWLEDKFGTVPIFNHPKGIRATVRDRVPALLGGIPDLTVPKTIRTRFRTVAELEQVFADNGFAFPVLIRPVELQGGVGLLRIDGPQDWEDALYTRFHGQEHFMTQFVESATDAGEYRKLRVAFVGGQPYLRHIKVGPSWMVHNTPSDIANDFEATRELPMIDALRGDTRLVAICDQIGQRVPLDLFAADIGINPGSGQFVLFEANASVSVFFPERENETPERLLRRDLLQAPAEAAFVDLLQRPDQWRRPA